MKKEMSKEAKKVVELSLMDIAIMRAVEKHEGADIVEIDEYIAERGKTLFEEIENLKPQKLALKMLERMMKGMEEDDE